MIKFQNIVLCDSSLFWVHSFTVNIVFSYIISTIILIKIKLNVCYFLFYFKAFSTSSGQEQLHWEWEGKYHSLNKKGKQGNRQNSVLPYTQSDKQYIVWKSVPYFYLLHMFKSQCQFFWCFGAIFSDIFVIAWFLVPPIAKWSLY